MKKTVKLRVDHRDLHFHRRFGGVMEFPQESSFGANDNYEVEGSEEVDCTAESGSKVCSSQTKALYDHTFLWNNTKKDASGADPRDSMKAIVSSGMKRTDGTIDKKWKSYYRADTGDQDAFDNVRSAMMINESSCTVATFWYENWENANTGTILPPGDIVVSAHDYVAVDWTQKGGVPMMKIDAHTGETLYMTREVFNAALYKMGTGAYMPCQNDITPPQAQIFQTILDAMKNFLLWVKQTYLNG